MALPVINSQPQSRIVLVGSAVTLSVSATGATGYQWYFEGVAITGATSSSYSFANIAEANFGIYRVVVSNSDGSVNSDAVEIQVAVTILDRIELNMAALIAGMTKRGGYNYDWQTVNNDDEAEGGFPRAIIDPSDGIADKETCMDTLAGLGSGDYTNEVLFTILAKGLMSKFSANAEFDCRSMLRKACDDLKRLFGINNQLNGSCDNVLYVGSQIETIKRNDAQKPAQLRFICKVVYSQDRQTPTLYASA